MVPTWALKGLQYHDFGDYVYTIVVDPLGLVWLFTAITRTPKVRKRMAQSLRGWPHQPSKRSALPLESTLQLALTRPVRPWIRPWGCGCRFWRAPQRWQHRTAFVGRRRGTLVRGMPYVPGGHPAEDVGVIKKRGNSEGGVTCV